jgi:hypothetical protein
MDAIQIQIQIQIQFIFIEPNKCVHLYGVKLQWTVCAVQDSDERNKKNG